MGFTFPDTSAENAARAISDCAAAFGDPVSDGPTHVKKYTVLLVSKGLKLPHNFTLPNCPWSNGALEHVRKELLGFLWSVASELPLRPD